MQAMFRMGIPVVGKNVFPRNIQGLPTWYEIRVSAEGYTVLIVEQNIRQVLKVASRGYLLETGRIRAAGTAAELLDTDEIKKAYLGI